MKKCEDCDCDIQKGKLCTSCRRKKQSRCTDCGKKVGKEFTLCDPCRDAYDKR